MLRKRLSGPFCVGFDLVSDLRHGSVPWGCEISLLSTEGLNPVVKSMNGQTADLAEESYLLRSSSCLSNSTCRPN
jgi:hypothetical protein